MKVDNVSIVKGMEVYIIHKVKGYADVLPVLIRTILDDCFIGYCERDGKAYIRFYSNYGVDWCFDQHEAVELAETWEERWEKYNESNAKGKK